MQYLQKGGGDACRSEDDNNRSKQLKNIEKDQVDVPSDLCEESMERMMAYFPQGIRIVAGKLVDYRSHPEQKITTRVLYAHVLSGIPDGEQVLIISPSTGQVAKALEQGLGVCVYYKKDVFDQTRLCDYDVSPAIRQRFDVIRNAMLQGKASEGVWTEIEEIEGPFHRIVDVHVQEQMPRVELEQIIERVRTLNRCVGVGSPMWDAIICTLGEAEWVACNCDGFRFYDPEDAVMLLRQGQYLLYMGSVDGLHGEKLYVHENLGVEWRGKYMPRVIGRVVGTNMGRIGPTTWLRFHVSETEGVVANLGAGSREFYMVQDVCTVGGAGVARERCFIVPRPLADKLVNYVQDSKPTLPDGTPLTDKDMQVQLAQYLSVANNVYRILDGKLYNQIASFTPWQRANLMNVCLHRGLSLRKKYDVRRVRRLESRVPTFVRSCCNEILQYLLPRCFIEWWFVEELECNYTHVTRAGFNLRKHQPAVNVQEIGWQQLTAMKLRASFRGGGTSMQEHIAKHGWAVTFKDECDAGSEYTIDVPLSLRTLSRMSAVSFVIRSLSYTPNVLVISALMQALGERYPRTASFIRAVKFIVPLLNVVLVASKVAAALINLTIKPKRRVLPSGTMRGKMLINRFEPAHFGYSCNGVKIIICTTDDGRWYRRTTTFTPSEEVAEATCAELAMENANPVRYCPEGDGNCFYRAISYALKGNEESHALYRSWVSTQLGAMVDEAEVKRFAEILSEKTRTGLQVVDGNDELLFRLGEQKNDMICLVCSDEHYQLEYAPAGTVAGERTPSDESEVRSVVSSDDTISDAGSETAGATWLEHLDFQIAGMPPVGNLHRALVGAAAAVRASERVSLEQAEDRLNLVAGVFGSGKTLLLTAIMAMYDRKVRYVGPQSVVETIEQRLSLPARHHVPVHFTSTMKMNCDAHGGTTLHKFLAEGSHGTCVICFDEAFLAGAGAVEAVLSVNPEAIVVAVGDPGQLSAVNFVDDRQLRLLEGDFALVQGATYRCGSNVTRLVECAYAHVEGLTLTSKAQHQTTVTVYRTNRAVQKVIELAKQHKSAKIYCMKQKTKRILGNCSTAHEVFGSECEHAVALVEANSLQGTGKVPVQGGVQKHMLEMFTRASKRIDIVIDEREWAMAARFYPELEHFLARDKLLGGGDSLLPRGTVQTEDHKSHMRIVVKQSAEKEVTACARREIPGLGLIPGANAVSNGYVASRGRLEPEVDNSPFVTPEAASKEVMIDLLHRSYPSFHLASDVVVGSRCLMPALDKSALNGAKIDIDGLGETKKATEVYAVHPVLPYHSSGDKHFTLVTALERWGIQNLDQRIKQSTRIEAAVITQKQEELAAEAYEEYKKVYGTPKVFDFDVDEIIAFKSLGWAKQLLKSPNVEGLDKMKFAIVCHSMFGKTTAARKCPSAIDCDDKLNAQCKAARRTALRAGTDEAWAKSTELHVECLSRLRVTPDQVLLVNSAKMLPKGYIVVANLALTPKAMKARLKNLDGRDREMVMKNYHEVAQNAELCSLENAEQVLTNYITEVSDLKSRDHYLMKWFGASVSRVDPADLEKLVTGNVLKTQRKAGDPVMTLEQLADSAEEVYKAFRSKTGQPVAAVSSAFSSLFTDATRLLGMIIEMAQGDTIMPVNCPGFDDQDVGQFIREKLVGHKGDFYCFLNDFTKQDASHSVFTRTAFELMIKDCIREYERFMRAFNRFTVMVVVMCQTVTGIFDSRGNLLSGLNWTELLNKFFTRLARVMTIAGTVLAEGQSTRKFEELELRKLKPNQKLEAADAIVEGEKGDDTIVIFANEPVIKDVDPNTGMRLKIQVYKNVGYFLHRIVTRYGAYPQPIRILAKVLSKPLSTRAEDFERGAGEMQVDIKNQVKEFCTVQKLAETIAANVQWMEANDATVIGEREVSLAAHQLIAMSRMSLKNFMGLFSRFTIVYNVQDSKVCKRNRLGAGSRVHLSLDNRPGAELFAPVIEEVGRRFSKGFHAMTVSLEGHRHAVLGKLRVNEAVMAHANANGVHYLGEKVGPAVASVQKALGECSKLLCTPTAWYSAGAGGFSRTARALDEISTPAVIAVVELVDAAHVAGSYYRVKKLQGLDLTAMARRAGVNTTFMLNAGPPNAMAIGCAKRSFVFVSTGLVDLGLSDEELGSIIYHELGHIRLGHSGMMLLGMFMPLRLMGLIRQNNERSADLFAVSMTHKPQALANALKRMWVPTRTPTEMLVPTARKSVAYLSVFRAWVGLAVHPTMQVRINWLEGMNISKL